MNNKAYIIGFVTMDSVINGVSAAKRSIVNATKSPVHCAKTGVLNTSEVVTSFFAGAKQAIKYRRGTCLMIAYDERSNEEG